jgi:hypothetical protein
VERDNQHLQYQDRNSTIYDPYAPTLSHATPPAPSVYPPTQYNTSTTVRSPNPYIPAPAVPLQPSTQTPYSYTPSSQPQSTASTYSSPYASVHQPTYTPVNTNPTTISSQIPPQALPPVPLPVASINRPKLSNAYDPPFPTTKPSRRSARTGSGQQSYTGYSAYQPISPPVPESHVATPPYPPPPPFRTPSQQPAQSLGFYEQSYSGQNDSTTHAADVTFTDIHSHNVPLVDQAEAPWSLESATIQPVEESYPSAANQFVANQAIADTTTSESSVEGADSFQHHEPHSTGYDEPTSPEGTGVQPPSSSSESRSHASSPVSHSPLSHTGSVRSFSPGICQAVALGSF